MAHFAQVENGIVVSVIKAEQDYVNRLPGQWIQTSYNTRAGIHYDPSTGEPSLDQSKALRKNYAGIDYAYDIARDAFIPPKPFESWVLNEATCHWEAPVEYPDDGFIYDWDESTISWVLESGNADPAMIRARNPDGTFIADDPATPDIDEAWVAAP